MPCCCGGLSVLHTLLHLAVFRLAQPGILLQLVQGADVSDPWPQHRHPVVQRRSQDDNSRTGNFECVAVQESNFGGDTTDFDRWYCSDDGDEGQLFEINRPNAWFKARGIESGQSLIAVKGARKARGSFNKAPTFSIGFDDSVEIRTAGNRRRLNPSSTMGEKSMLVIRGISGDGQPTKSAGALADDLFGDLVGGSDPANLASQYDACSKGQLTFVPATGSGIVNGVLQVTIPENINGMNRITAHNLFIEKAAEIVGSLQQWSLTFLVMQSGVDFEQAGAYAFINSWLSVYSDSYASMLVVQMHEVGHNMGMSHSGEVATTDDHTCMMGIPSYQDDGTIQCFNGAKSWYLGWYADRHSTASPTNAAWEGLLAGVHDYVIGDTTSAHSVVVKIGDPSSSADLYLMYNKKAGVNSQVKEYGNTVTVVRAENDDSRSRQSYIVGHMAEGEEYRGSSFGGSGQTLVVKVCDAADTARVIIYIEGRNDVACGGPPRPSPEVPNCFSGFNTVVVENKGEIRMDALRIGDMVETARGFSRVISFGHLSHDAPTSFLKIVAGKNKLEVTAEHIVYANHGKMVRAGDIVIGDMLGEDTVTSIDSVQRTGFYAPSTEAGDIQVSGIRASCYAALLDLPVRMQHEVTDMFHAPLRLACSFDFAYCQKMSYDAFGFSNYVSAAAAAVIMLEGQSKWIHGAMIVAGAPLLLVAHTVEKLTRNPYPYDLFMTIAGAAGAYVVFRKTATKTV